MRENHKRSVWPHAQGPGPSQEGLSVLEGELETNAQGCFLWWIHVPSPPPSPAAVPNLDFYGNEFHAWASHELS